MEKLVSEGDYIIFGISFSCMDALDESAAKYTDGIFSHATGYTSNETNFCNYFGRTYQARYLAGIAAGLKSLEIAKDAVLSEDYPDKTRTELFHLADEKSTGINSVGMQKRNNAIALDKKAEELL